MKPSSVIADIVAFCVFQLVIFALSERFGWGLNWRYLAGAAVGWVMVSVMHRVIVGRWYQS